MGNAAGLSSTGQDTPSSGRSLSPDLGEVEDGGPWTEGQLDELARKFEGNTVTICVSASVHRSLIISSYTSLTTHALPPAVLHLFSRLPIFREVSKTEMQLLWHRFQALGPDVQGCLDRSVFQRPPYSEDIFCRQVEAFTTYMYICGKGHVPCHVFRQPQYTYDSVFATLTIDNRTYHVLTLSLYIIEL